MGKYSIKDIVRPFGDQAVCTPETPLGTAADLVRTSFEPIFVFRELPLRGAPHGLVGIISMYDALYLKEMARTTRAEHACFPPPHLTARSSAYDVAAEMVARRLNVLPVFSDNGEIGGIVAAADLVRAFLPTELGARTLMALQPEEAVAIPYESCVKDAFHALRDRGISEVLVLAENGAVAGIVSREDIIKARAKPTARQRHTSRGNKEEFPKEEFYGTEFVSQDYYPLRRYYQPAVSVERDSEPTYEHLADYIHKLTETPYSNLVLIDRDARPRELITYQDILEAILRSRPTVEIPILVHDQRERFSAIERDRILEVMESFYESYHRRTPMDHIVISFEESRTPSKTIRAIQVTIKAILKSGRVMVTRSERHDAMTAFRDSFKEIKAQLDRLHGKIQEHAIDK